MSKRDTDRTTPPRHAAARVRERRNTRRVVDETRREPRDEAAQEPTTLRWWKTIDFRSLTIWDGL